jgi:hypothetical protein
VAEAPSEARPEPPRPPRRGPAGAAPAWAGERHDWALVQELVAACGGTLGAWSASGRDGHFTLVLPAP